MDKSAKIYIAGHRGMLGSAIKRNLESKGYTNLVYRTSKELDLRDQEQVNNFFAEAKPEYVFIAAAKVGGINANIQYPVEFLYDNLQIQNNLITACYKHSVNKVSFIGSSCIYPRECQQPMKEEYLMTGPLEPTNEGYALAKISGIKLLQYYHKEYGMKSVCPLPCNLYGTNDSFDLKHAHVLSSLVKKFSDAKENNSPTVEVWGTGEARREFLHVDDAAEMIVELMDEFEAGELVNVGSGKDVSIKELAELIAAKTNFPGELSWDTSKPNGMPRKCLDIAQIEKLGYSPSISLEQGIELTIQQYKENSL
jgi:GDP-L-fucose synthase